MKILYAIQGTGNGHLARAEDVIPALQQHGRVDVFVSGAQADITLSFPIRYRSKGLSFYFGKNGGVDFMKTFLKNSSKRVLHEIKSFPIDQYDVVVNDFEPISAWAARRRQVRCIALSHQCALLSTRVPKPNHADPMGEWVLRHYAPADAHVGFHFARFDRNIFTPVIRKRIREVLPKDQNHYTVYLPAYADRKLVLRLLQIPLIRWHVFSKHTRKAYHIGRVSVYPVSSDDFVASLITAKGVLCGAGFETPAEALYLGKKLLVVPMKSQYEQHYNAAALRSLGVPVLKDLKKKRLHALQAWVESSGSSICQFPDITAEAVALAIKLAKA